MAKVADKHNLKCPACGHDRFQRHERGTFEYDEQGNASKLDAPFRIDEIAVQCLKCLRVFGLAELIK